jgi:hypothetical protein
MSDINANLVLNAGSANYGVVTKATVVNSGAANNGEITGAATFTGTAVNNGAVTVATFQDSAVNSSLAVAYTASFSGSASNSGAAVAASFTDSAVNTGAVVASGEFSGSASNTGTAAAAVFSGTASNSGTVQTAVFSDSASNAGTVASVVVFTGNAVNTGTVAQAIFSGSAVNQGTVTASATFQDSASNSATGSIQGDAVFADTTSNAGSVAGTASVAATATNTGTAGTVVEYIQPNGYFSNGYFSGGSAGVSATKTAPENYATIVHSVGGVWYKYDNAGSASLAAGNYDDGSGTTYVFVSGLRKSVYNPPAWYSDSSSAAHTVTLNGTVTQSDEGNGVVAAQFDGTGGKLATDLQGGFSGDLTIEAFVKFNGASPSYFISNVDDNGNQGIAMGLDSGSLRVTWEQYGENVTSISTGTWHHVALTRASGAITLWIDGVGYGVSNSYTFASTMPFFVSTLNGSIYPFDGSITGLRIVNGTAVYTSNFTVPTTLPTNISGTQLLLNFSATAAPTVTAPSTWYSDSSSAAHTVTLNGTVTQSDEGNGVVAAQFDGSTGYIKTLNSVTLEQSFTLEAFVYKLGNSNASGAAGDIFAQEAGGVQLNSEDNGTLWYSQFWVQNIASAFADLTGGWHHAVLVRNGTDVGVYVDGIKVISTTDNTDFGSSPIYIGGEPLANQFLNGKIAGVRVVRGTAVYTSNFSVPTTLPTDVAGTQLLLNFGATAAPTVTAPSTWYSDSSSAAHTVTLNGSVTQSDEGNGVVAASFDGSGYLITDQSTALDIGGVDSTISFWIKPTQYAYQPVIQSTVSDAGQLNIHVSGDGNLHVNNGQAGDAATSIELNIWQHIAVVVSSGSKYVFVNGVLQTTTSQMFGSTEIFKIGGDAYGNNFVGSIAGVQIVKGTALYSSNFSVPTTLPTNISGTQLLLNFGATAAPTVTAPSTWYSDSSSAAHTVTLNGSVTQSDEGNGVVAAQFDGNSSLTIDSDNNLDVSASDFTIEMWVKVSGYDVANSASFFGKDSTAYVHGSTLGGWFTPNAIGVTFSDGQWNAGTHQELTASMSVSLDTWYHIELARDNATNTVYLFVNGELKDSATLSVTINDLGLPWCFGRADKDYPNSILNGKMTGVRIVKGSVLHTSNFSVPTTLPTDVAGTQLLLNFGATAAPAV